MSSRPLYIPEPDELTDAVSGFLQEVSNMHKMENNGAYSRHMVMFQ